MINSYSQEFKQASVGLLLNILYKVNSTDSEKYYKFFQKELNITPVEFAEIKELKEFKKAHQIIKMEDEVSIVIESLNHKQHQIMNFLMMLNRCIIIDGCTFESYQKFEEVRDSFLSAL